ncbi:cytosolic factor, phosphatidylinositol/phosphatidylcholine transfer protein [Agyrium rufum]|nr:cytosolic factor, phosphatidylinositol/phosphatidylcholine transfer protein [Agyrium rufum]
MAAPTNKMELDPKYDNYDFPIISPNTQSGHPGHITAQQEAQVFQLRTQLEQAGCKDRLDTLTMLRFLRARKFDVAASMKMFLDCEKWRKDFGVDDLVRNFDYKEKPQVFQYYPQYYHKTDKDGRPVYIEHLGKVDLPAMYRITTADRMLQNLVVEYEKVADPRLPACSRKSGHLLETCCTIMDLKGVGISKASSVYGYVQQASGISQNYYPERLGKLYIVNAPWGFAGVFSFIKGFLDPITVAKIHVLGSGYQKELLQQIPAENLPQSLGGKCDCPGGCQLADLGPWTEKEWTRTPKWAQQDPSTQTIKNDPGATEPTPVASGTAPAAGKTPAPYQDVTDGDKAQAPMPS